MSISKSCDPINQLWFYDLRENNFKIEGELKFTKLVDNFDAKYSVRAMMTNSLIFYVSFCFILLNLLTRLSFYLKYITNTDSKFIFETNLNALKYKLVSIDLNDAERKWSDFVPEKEDVLQSVSCVNQSYLLLNYMHNCKVLDYAFLLQFATRNTY